MKSAHFFCFVLHCTKRRCSQINPQSKVEIEYGSELGTFEWWITGLMLDPLFFLISRLNNACSPLYINLQINLPIRIKDIPF